MNKAKIYYYDIGDYLSREDKLRIIKQFGSIERIPWTILQPNEHGDWINHRNEMFKLFMPIEPEKKFVKGQKSFLKRMLLVWQLIVMHGFIILLNRHSKVICGL